MTDVAPVKRAQTIPQDRILPLEFAANTWRLRPFAETDIEDVLRSEYWAHVATKLQAGELIQVLPEDRAYFAELIVLDCGRTWAKVMLLRKVDLVAVKRQEIKVDGFTVTWRGPRKYSVVRATDKQVMSEDHATKESALAWLDQHQKTVTA